ncbi:MAG TPA: N-acetylmuramoyl-L-alanine amidase [Pyrinomonadaceae bacterium]|jgi:hypothetical protein
MKRKLNKMCGLLALACLFLFAVTFTASGQTASSLQPNIVLRAYWGAVEPVTILGDKSCNQSNGTLTNIFIHHTQDDGSSLQDASFGQEWLWVNNIQTYHQLRKQYCDISYHYLIGPSGTIYEGRKGGVRTKGGHIEDMNTGTVGIAMLGNFHNNLPTAEAMESLNKLLIWLLLDNNLEPEGLGHMTTGLFFSPTISGHRHINWSERFENHTSCPGDALFNHLATLRREVNERIRNLESKYLFRASNSQTVYRIRNGRKQAFTSSYVFNSYYGQNWNYIKVVSPRFLINYPEGSPIPFRDGTLIAYSDRPRNSTVFVVYNGKKRAFRSWNYFLELGGRYQLGYSADKIMRVPGAIIDQIPSDVDMVNIVHCSDCRNT